MADVLGFATKGSGGGRGGSSKAVAFSNGTQKNVTAIQKNAGVLADVVGQGADSSYKQFVASGGPKASVSGPKSSGTSNSSANAGTPQRNTGATPPKASAPANSAPKGLLGKLSTYGKALITSPVSTVKDIASGQQIDAVDNGALILKRAPLSVTSKIKQQQSKNLPAGTPGQLDHVVPLEAGGTNKPSNLKLIPKSADDANNNVENFLGAQLRANVINAQQAKQLALDYKSGKITDKQVYQKASPGGMPKGPSLLSKTTKAVGDLGNAFAKPIEQIPADATLTASNLVNKALGRAPISAKEASTFKNSPVATGVKYAGASGKNAQLAADAGQAGLDIATGGIDNLAIKGAAKLAPKVASTFLGKTVARTLANAPVGAAYNVLNLPTNNQPLTAKNVKTAAIQGSEAALALTAGGSLLAHGAGKVISKASDALSTKASKDLATNATVNTILSKIKLPKSTTDKLQAQADASQAAEKEAAAAAKLTQDNQAKATKLDQQIELINAKKADGKFTNVDKVKVQQLKDQKAQLTPAEAPVATMPAVTEPAAPVRGNAMLKQQEANAPVATTKEPVATTSPANGVHSINVFGKTIPMTEENGFKAAPTKDGDVVYSKTAMRGNNAKGDRQAITHYYTSDGKNITQAQHEAMIKPAPAEGSMAAAGEAKPITPAAPNPDTIKEQIKNIKSDDKSYDPHGNITPEAAKSINALNKQLNAAGVRVPKAEKPVTVTPIAETPKVAAPDIKTSKLAQGVETNAIKKGLTDGFSGKAEYAGVKISEQTKGAADLLKNDPGRAVRIAMGHEPSPEGLLPESVFIAVERQATKAGDSQLLQRLATESHLTSEASGMGQRIRMLGERDTHSAVSNIKAVAKAKADALQGKLKGTTVAKATSAEIRQIRAAKPAVTKETFSSFVDSLKC